jgi:drug/metabolite transporter (DMT)-like permease
MKSPDRDGIGFALAGFVLLSMGDAVVKSMAGQWAPTAMAALRYSIGAAGLSVALALREGVRGFAAPLLRWQIARGVGVAIATISFFSSLQLMSLAEATTLVFVSPMITGLLAPLILGEPSRKETWIASVIAFVGVVIVLRPNVQLLGWAALLPLLSAFGMSILMIANRAVANSASPLAMQAFVALAAAPLLLIATAVGHASGLPQFAVHAPPTAVIVKCAVVAMSATTAHWLIYLGTTRSGAATIAPMTYVQLVVATAAGWVLFGNQPDLAAMLGALIIIGAGLYLWRTGGAREPAREE